MSSSLDVPVAVIVVVASIAVAFDVTTRRIPNYLTFGAAAAALFYGFASNGIAGMSPVALGWFVGALLFFPFFALRGMGAGDVKLMAALSAWLGPMDAVWLAIFASIAGGVVAIGVSLAHGYLGRAFSNIWVMVMHWRVAGPTPVPGLTLRETRSPRLAYAIPIAIGAVCTLWRR